MNRRELLMAGMALGAAGMMGKSNLALADAHLYVPPEEAPHELTFMQWPVNRKVHSDPEFLELLQETIAEIANTISRFEPVIMLAAEADHKLASKMLEPEIELWDIPTEDLWCRDSGPLFAITPEKTLVVSHIQFNGWGDKQVHRRDGKIAAEIARQLGVERVPSGIVGEAGGVEHDGHGLLMAHESSWVNPNRNPAMTRDEIEKRLLAAYGADKMIWSPGVWGADITDYHIDSLARFTGPGRILMNLPAHPDGNDPFHNAAIETFDILIAGGLDVEVIHEPEKRRVDDIEFVASYANYYVFNGGVIAAQFGDDETDELAQKALEMHYPDREIVTLNVDALGEIGGGIHCATQQMPRV